MDWYLVCDSGMSHLEVDTNNTEEIVLLYSKKLLWDKMSLFIWRKLQSSARHITARSGNRKNDGGGYCFRHIVSSLSWS